MTMPAVTIVRSWQSALLLPSFITGSVHGCISPGLDFSLLSKIIPNIDREAIWVQGIRVFLCRTFGHHHRLKKPQRRTGQLILAYLTLIASLNGEEFVKPSSTFRATDSLRAPLGKVPCFFDGKLRIRYSASPAPVYSVAAVSSFYSARSSSFRYGTSATERRCNHVLAAATAHAPSQLWYNLGGVIRSVEGQVRAHRSTSAVSPVISYARRCRLMRLMPPGSAGLAYAQLLSCNHFSVRGKTGFPYSITPTEKRPHRYFDVWPGYQHVSTSAGTAAAQATPEQLKKDASHLDALRYLRSLTGCSVVACKEALQTCKGDIPAAVDWLRRRGLAVSVGAAEHSAGSPQRKQTEGVIAVASWRGSAENKAGRREAKRRRREVADTSGSTIIYEGELALKLSCSTDFVARNTRITQFARRVAELLADHLGQVGLRDIFETPAARGPTGGVTVSQAEPVAPPELKKRPSDQQYGAVVARGAALIDTLLTLPWSPGEATEGHAAEPVGAGKAVFRAGNFFKDQHMMPRAGAGQTRSQAREVLREEAAPDKEPVRGGDVTLGDRMNCHHPGETLSTIREELQYLASIVKEPLSITDAVAIEVPVDCGAVASYVHGLIDKQVGTLAVLTALTADQESGESIETTHRLAKQSAPATTEALQDSCGSHGLHAKQHQRLHKSKDLKETRSGGTTRGMSEACTEQQEAPQPRSTTPLKGATTSTLSDRMRPLAESVCMQVAAGKPLAVDEHSLDRQLLSREEAVYRAQAEATGKPPATIGRMVTGKLNKWLKEVLLIRQTWLLDDSGMTVQQKLSEFATQQRMKNAPRIETFVKIQIP